MKKIKIGRISGAQGLRGEVRLYHDSGDEEAIRRLTSLFLRKEDDETEARIEELRMHKRTPILKLEGVEGRDAAEALAGFDVYALDSEARPDEDGVWLVSDLVGLEVRAAAGPGEISVGTIKSIIDNPAHDILEIDNGDYVRLLPLVDVFVKEVLPEAGYIIIIPPEGWLA